MVLHHICARIKSIFLGILAIFRRALCCFSRRRKRSYSECEILDTISIQNDSHSSKHKNDVERDWNSWDDSPRTVDEHIEHYRQRLGQSQESPDEPHIDFFQDMTPKIIKQKKVLIKTDNPNGPPNSFSRLQATSAANIPIVQTAELEDWTDEETQAGWDELSDETTKAMIREKRRELRAQRQQQQHLQKLRQAQMQSGFAERVATTKKI